MPRSKSSNFATSGTALYLPTSTLCHQHQHCYLALAASYFIFSRCAALPCAVFTALLGTVANLYSDLACTGGTAKAEGFFDPIFVALRYSAPDARHDVTTSDEFEGLRVSLHEPSAEAPWIGFNDDGKEPTRRGLYAAQELMWTERSAAIFVVAVTSSHCSLHQA